LFFLISASESQAKKRKFHDFSAVSLPDVLMISAVAFCADEEIFHSLLNETKSEKRFHQFREILSAIGNGFMETSGSLLGC
jgi:hypothetical protein